MPSLGLKGPYDLDLKTIDKVVKKRSPGNFAIGGEASSGRFSVHFVGRSDTDVASAIKEWVGKTDKPYFKFDYSSSPTEAFKRECENYHDFMPDANTEHPKRIESSKWKCPRCLEYGL